MDLFESMMQGHRKLREDVEDGRRNFTVEYENPYRRYESETADYQASSPEEALSKFLSEFGEEFKDKIYLIYDESDYEWVVNKDGSLRPVEEFDMYQDDDEIPAYFTQEDGLNDVFDECVTESAELEEAFSKSIPPEVVDILAKVYWNNPKDALLKKGLDLANLTYVDTDPPTSNRDPILKDPNKVCFFVLDDNGKEKVYIPDYYQPFLSSEGKETSQLPWKAILAHAKRFGYVDLTDPQNMMLDKRKERKSIDRSADRNPEKAQYQKDDGTWADFASKGYDKNGYKVDSQKYQRMLDTLGEDNYKEVMAKYGDRINAMADRIADLLKDRRNSSNYRNLDYIDGAIRGLRDASSSFEELGKSISRYYEWSQQEGDEGSHFRDRYPTLKDYLDHGWASSAEHLRSVRKELAYAEDNLKKIKDKFVEESLKEDTVKVNEDFYVGWAKMKDPSELKQWLKDNPTHSIYCHSDGSYYIGSSEKDPYSMELDRDIIDTLRQDEFFKDMLKEDTVKKKNGKWTNRGDDGKEHGEFNTKKEADAQRKAMFANGYKAESKKRVMKEASIPGDNYSVYQCTFDVAVPQEMRLYGLSGQSDGAFFKDLSKFLEDHGMVMAGDEISAIDMTNEYEEIFADEGGVRQYFFGEY